MVDRDNATTQDPLSAYAPGVLHINQTTVCQRHNSAKPTRDNVHRRMAVTELEKFICSPPPGFSVEIHNAGYCVKSDPEKCLVLIDPLESNGAVVVFHNSLGR